MGLYGQWIHFEDIKNNFSFMGILGPEGAITRFKKNISLTLQTSPNRFKWALGGLFLIQTL